MIKKLGNRNLLLILVALLALFGIMRYRSNRKGENTFKTTIIPKIDTTKLNKIVIIPKLLTLKQAQTHKGNPGDEGKPFTIEKKGAFWYVSRGNVTSRAEERSEHNLVQMVQQINPDRLASNDSRDWKDLNVNDSLGTRVVFFYGNDTILDLIVGRFSYVPGPKTQMNFGRNNGTAYSAVRLNHYTDVYKIEGFLTLNVSDEFASWRDKKIMPGEYKSWNTLTFTYPADSGFTVKKDSSGWVFGDGTRPDSATAANAIKTISDRNYGAFIDVFDSTNKQPLYFLKIEGSNFSPVVIKAYPADTTNQLAICSSMLPGSFFSGKNDGEFNKIFLSKAAFFKKKN